jgi:hypothetical protein
MRRASRRLCPASDILSGALQFAIIVVDPLEAQQKYCEPHDDLAMSSILLAADSIFNQHGWSSRRHEASE